jgi:hypothetical protein
MSEESKGDPQANKPCDHQSDSESSAPVSRESAGTHGSENKQGVTHQARKLLCWLCPRTPQDLWNFLLVIFTGILAVVAWNQYASDTAYLTLGQSTFRTGSGVSAIGIENDGRRPSSEVITTIYRAYFDQQGNIVGNISYKSIDVMPEVPAGKMPYTITFNFPNWDALHLKNVRDGVETLRVGIVLNYRAPVFGRTESRFCQEISSIKDSDLSWAPCDLSFLHKMEATEDTNPKR